MLKDKKVIIFDLDGTLIDSVGMWNEVDRRLILQLGGHPEEETVIQSRRDELLTRFRGETAPYAAYCASLGALCGSGLSAKDIHKLRYEIADGYLKNTVKLKPGAAELLSYLKAQGRTLVLASTTSRANVEKYMQWNENIKSKANFGALFSRIYTRDDVTELKPSPQVHKLILSALSASPDDCLVVEDSLAGVEAANAANIAVVAVADRNSAQDETQIRARSDAFFSDCAALHAFFAGGKAGASSLDKPDAK